jgi:hypothetical protein
MDQHQSENNPKPEPTHVWLYFSSQNTEMLFRASDGICIGQRKDETVVFGDKPNKRESHIFMDKEHAIKWLREVWAARDMRLSNATQAMTEDEYKILAMKPLSDFVPVIEERDGEGMVVLPPDSIGIVTNGSMSPFKH